MSHSKTTKNGYSLYIEKWNPMEKNISTPARFAASRDITPLLKATALLIALREELYTVN